MISKKYVVECDNCGRTVSYHTDVYKKGDVEKVVKKEEGWFKVGKKDFCTGYCKEEYFKLKED